MDLAVPWWGGFFTWLTQASWQAGVLIVLILITQRAFGDRLSATWRFNLWLLVVLKLLLPIAPKTNFSIFNLFELKPVVVLPQASQPTQEASDAVTETVAVSQISPAPARVAAPAPVPASPPAPLPRATRWTASHVLVAVWLLGAFALTLPVIVQMWRLRWRIGRQRQVTDAAALDLLEDCKELMHVRVPLVVVETNEVESPVLYGFIRPRLLLPEGLISNFGREELRFIFLHELAHLKRADIFVNWLMTALQILHWFNPLVWIAFARMRGDRELACDHLALEHTRNEQVQSYGETVIKLLEAFSRPAVFPGLLGILDEQSFIRRRIVAIARFRRTPRMSFPALAVGAALGLITLTDARHSDPLDALDRLLHPGGGSWELRSSPPRDFARVSYSAIWTGREMLVWGGAANGRYFGDGARYSPAADAWRPISTNGAPAGRWFHAGVWTGQEMIVWGGRSRFDVGLSNRNDGARYDPATDRWRAMSQANTPAPRSQVASVWTGTELIVWGGVGAEARPVAGGGRYDPLRDQWKPLPTDGAPEARFEPSYVWTGKELIVWGGMSYAGGERTFRSGGRFDPIANQWRPINLTGAPSDATGMNAIWTGKEMIVWSGRRIPGNHFLTEGALYNPATDTWRAMNTQNVPPPRALYVAAWTGDAMIVWGGLGAENPAHPDVVLNSGAIYDPQRDQWTPLTTRAPEMRHFGRHDLGLWTGEGFLVFGGSNINLELHSLHYWRPGESGAKLAAR